MRHNICFRYDYTDVDGEASISATSSGTVTSVQLPPGACVNNATPNMFESNAFGCVQKSYNLVWSREATSMMGYSGASLYCLNLNEGGGTGWRLPYGNEIATLINEGGQAYVHFMSSPQQLWMDFNTYGGFNKADLGSNADPITADPGDLVPVICVRSYY